MKPELEKITEIVERIVSIRGKAVDATIPILQDIQTAFNYLPQEALEHVCRITEITPSRISGIATFYSQFRLEPAGEHTIRVCTGTACHVKGSGLVYDAFQRELKLEGSADTDDSGKFTLEKVACLGCCTLAPVVKIDHVTYGHVQPEKVSEIISDFLSRKASGELIQSQNGQNSESQGEVRIGLGSCCIASGSSEVKEELERTLKQTRIQVNVKQVGCVGICNQVPIMEIVKPGEESVFYAKIKPEEVKEVLLRHFKPEGILNKLRNKFITRFETL
ncbi:MAG: NAD(P)H-dependent oxidoreductase subunit E, partial [Bacteroidales bacterium]|nr:NAD(P)H-dependent oxidoreductase subunit E [Bacteroidales bacterium]